MTFDLRNLLLKTFGGVLVLTIVFLFLCLILFFINRYTKYKPFCSYSDWSTPIPELCLPKDNGWSTTVKRHYTNGIPLVCPANDTKEIPCKKEEIIKAANKEINYDFTTNKPISGSSSEHFTLNNASLTPSPNFSYYVGTFNTGPNTTTSGVGVNGYTCPSYPNSIFRQRMFSIKTPSGGCFDDRAMMVPTLGNAGSTYIYGTSATPNQNQFWVYDNITHQIKPAYKLQTNLCLDAGTTSNNNLYYLNTCNSGSIDQQFTYNQTTKQFVIEYNPSMCIDSTSGVISNKTCLAGPNQQFDLVEWFEPMVSTTSIGYPAGTTAANGSTVLATAQLACQTTLGCNAVTLNPTTLVYELRASNTLTPSTTGETTYLLMRGT